jgi:hypothetical protein
MTQQKTEVLDRTQKSLTEFEDVSSIPVLSYFQNQIPSFLSALHLGPRSIIEPSRLEQVKNARKYLTDVCKGYKELRCNEISKHISLQDVHDGVVRTPCLITFLNDSTNEEMYSELNSMIEKGKIVGIADGPLTVAFVRAKSFESGKLLENTIMIPRIFQKKKSTSKNFFRGVMLSRSVNGTDVKWRLFEPVGISHGISILAFR